ncbi:MAG: DUF5681 domain-containing protein [Acidobacteriaceae bacterium]
MDNEGSEFPVGYGKPPVHTRFQPGRSGNPAGRPKKKISTFPAAFERELNSRITINEGGKPRKITKRDAIVKQQTNKAIQGDAKATALVMKTAEPRALTQPDNLSPVLQAMRDIHAKHEIALQKNVRETGAFDHGNDAANHSAQIGNDHA